MKPSPEMKSEVLRITREKMQAWYEGYMNRDGMAPGPIENICLFWAHFTAETVREICNEPRAQVQAGTAYWPMIPDEIDDGTEPNQYGYEFEWTSRTMMNVAIGIPPEWHVWVAIPPGTIIDCTALFFKSRAIKEGFNFLCPDPPEIFWCNLDEWPDRVYYHADVRAIKLAKAMIRNYYGEPMALFVV